MTITVTELASATENTSTLSRQVTGITASPGDWLVVAVACNNAGTLGAVSLSGVTDSASHTYTERSLLNNDPGAANVGITLGIYSTLVTTSMSNGTITVSFSPATSAKAIQVWRLRPATGYNVGLKAQGSGNIATAATTQHTISSLAAADLVLGTVGVENRDLNATGDSDTTQGTWSTLWSTLGGGTGLSGTSLFSQYKTVTGNGDQSWDFSYEVSSDLCSNYFVFNEELTQKTATDTGSGNDLGPAPAVNLAATDDGVGADNLACAIQIILPDTATAADVISLLTGGTLISIIEAGAGEELLAIGVQIPVADTGAGADAAVVTPTAVTLIVTDAGAAAEIAAVLTHILATDQGVGAEVITSSIYLAGADAGTGLDAATAAVYCPLPDTGAGADAPTIRVSTLLTEAGSGLEVLQLLTGTLLALMDTGAGADVIQSMAVGLGLGDTGAAADVTALTVRLTLTDNASGAIAVAVQARVLGEDVGSGLDEITVSLAQILKTLSDLGQGAEALAVQVSVPVTDLGAGDVLALLSVLTTLADQVHGADAAVCWDSSVKLAYIRFVFRHARVSWTWRQRSCVFQLLSS